MNTRKFDHSDWNVSEIGLGCWQFGGDWGEMTDEKAFEILQAAIDSGVNFFDTADVYGGGRSEELIGRFLKERKLPVIVATKLGRFFDPGGDANYTESVVRRHTEASLRRLQVDALDVTQLHCIPVEQLLRGDVFDWLRVLKSEGKIRHFGASVESMEQALICLEQDELSSLQIIFNVFRQSPIEALFDKARARGVALIVRLPLASGLLSGKMTRDREFAPSDHRVYNRDGQAFNVGETFSGLGFDRGVALVEELAPFVPSQMSMAQMALRWILDHPAVTVIIPGATRPEQALANASASGLAPLSDDLHRRLKTFHDERVKPQIRGPQ